MGVIQDIQKAQMKTELPEFKVGDQVDVGVQIVEGDKQRTQVFNGVVIARYGKGIAEKFKVRRIVQDEGVERTFPLHSPAVLWVKVKRQGSVRRAKLYYLRGRLGKASRIKEKFETKE
ncbi:MAG TPA: 50S ribosomal protein L19 [Candidatus Brocadiia bacterium]|nr:50S ribosomal protein L19 [Candidatus Brocadiia bacterium]